jgi:hypothetical protein
MAITKYPPNTVWLGGRCTIVNDLPASETIRPGMLVERFDSGGGVAKYRKHATAAVATPLALALDQSMLNKGVDDDYAAGDLVEVGILDAGGTGWALIASGQNIAAGAKLESAGNGTFRVLAAGVAIATAMESVNNTAGPANARLRIEAI